MRGLRFSALVAVLWTMTWAFTSQSAHAQSLVEQAQERFEAGDHQAARQLYIRACEDEGNAVACHNVGSMARLGQSGTKDQAVSRGGYQRGCAKGLWQSCVQFGRMAKDGIGGPVQPELARVALDFACDNGHANSCVLLGAMLNREGGDQIAARAALWQGCQTGKSALACHNLGVMLNKGQGGARDVDGAKQAYHQGCEADVAASCIQLGTILTQQEKTAQARLAFDRACRQEDAQGCMMAGLSYQITALNGGNNELAQLRHYYDEACRLGLEDGCDTARRLPK